MNKFLILVSTILVLVTSACATGNQYAGGGYGSSGIYRRAFPRQAHPGLGNPNMTRAYGSVCTNEVPGRCIFNIDKVRHRADEPEFQYACGSHGIPLDGAYGTVTVPVEGAMLQCIDLTTADEAFFPGVRTGDTVSLTFVGHDPIAGGYKAYRKVTCGANVENKQTANLCDKRVL